MIVGVLDANAGGVGFPVPGMPGGVLVPHQLADKTGGVYLVVGGSFTCLPGVPAVFDSEVAGVVMQHNLRDALAAAALRVVLVHQQVFICL
ncbi:hypothetical protein A5774_02905 [Corynebacterium sp. EPI-003-04-2554_SCH2473622]|nr:hypothetical protein A5774_02905 [Corynebacterium sp. EPI-003-04-2554_SCH2473622]